MYRIECEVCRKKFDAKRRDRMYCGDRCKFKAYSKRHAKPKTCAKCGDKFESHNKAAKYCGLACSASSCVGRVPTDEQRQKMSKAATAREQRKREAKAGLDAAFGRLYGADKTCEHNKKAMRELMGGENGTD